MKSKQPPYLIFVSYACRSMPIPKRKLKLTDIINCLNIEFEFMRLANRCKEKYAISTTGRNSQNLVKQKYYDVIIQLWHMFQYKYDIS